MNLPAVFLDRDGTIIEDRGHLATPDEVVFFPDTVAALRHLQASGLRLLIVTHQPGIATGRLSNAAVQRVNAHVVAELQRHGIAIDGVYCCPHQRTDQCRCIKPHPFFMERAAAEHALDLSHSFVVGDHPHDVAMADRAGAVGIYVRSGHGERHRAELPPDQLLVPGIREAADWILAHLEMVRQEAQNPGLLEDAAQVLRNGGLVAFPTETVYGLGAVAFDETAVARIFESKQRPRFDPLIVHVADRAMLEQVATDIPAAAHKLIDHFWPGPLTLVLPKTAAVPDLVTAGLPTVAVRMPRHPLALALIRRTALPLAAPSANPFGRTSPTDAGHVSESLRGKVDRVLDGGPATVGIESTIVSLAGKRPVLLRPGGLPLEEIVALIGPVDRSTAEGGHPVSAPGMLARHYAPHTPFHLISMHAPPPRSHARSRVGLLAFQTVNAPDRFAAVEILAPSGDLREAAAHLFGAMRRLDRMNLDMIWAEYVPDTGLGMAINDRLTRAATPA